MAVTEKPINHWASDEEEENFCRRRHVYEQAVKRSLDAKAEYASRFNSVQHMENILTAYEAIQERFGDPQIYENCRGNGGEPFTALKLQHPHYHADDSKRKQAFLAALSLIPSRVEANPNNKTGNYIVKIYC